MTATLRFQQQGKTGVLLDVDGANGVHHNPDFQRLAHQMAPLSLTKSASIIYKAPPKRR
jgi:hypothetical protein